MRMLIFAAIVEITGSSAAMAQTNPVAAPALVATAHTTKVHAQSVPHHDGKRHPKITKVVHHSTVATPTGTATCTTTATTKTISQ